MSDMIRDEPIPAFSEALEHLLRRVEQQKKEMASLLPLDSHIQEQIARRFYIDWTYHSCNIEGNSYTRGETEIALIFDRPAAGKPGREYREVVGHGKAIKVIEELAQSAMPLTESDIKELNKLVLGEESYESTAITQEGLHTAKTIVPGTYKTLPNHVRTATGELFRYAEPYDVQPKMTELLDWYRMEEERKVLHPNVLASEFHFRFVLIHPFDDGNGRIARILMNYVLLRHDYPVVIIPTEEKDRYISALEHADVGDKEPFHRYIATREIESQNLWLRGASGESMEDVEKEAAILKASLQNPKMKVNPLILEKKIRRTVIESFIPFVEFATKKLEIFDDFYQEHWRNIVIAEIGTGEKKADYEQLKEIPVESFRLFSIKVVYLWGGLNVNPMTATATTRFEFKFSESGYSVESSFGARPPVVPIDKMFSEILTEEEKMVLVQSVSSQFLYYIRLIADEVGIDISPLTP